MRESDRAIGWMTECDDERVFPLSNPQTGARNPSFIATHLAKLAKSCTSGPTPIVEEAKKGEQDEKAEGAVNQAFLTVTSV